jgi:hypothetical protein
MVFLPKLEAKSCSIPHRPFWLLYTVTLCTFAKKQLSYVPVVAQTGLIEFQANKNEAMKQYFTSSWERNFSVSPLKNVHSKVFRMSLTPKRYLIAFYEMQVFLYSR